MASVEDRKAQLKARLKELDVRLHGIEDELEAHNNRDAEDMAVEREEDEVLEGLGNSGVVEIRMIGAALMRITEGTYGECVKCGDTISEARLDVLPYTPFCKTCAAAS